jgi:hypothetical protein
MPGKFFQGAKSVNHWQRLAMISPEMRRRFTQNLK